MTDAERIAGELSRLRKAAVLALAPVGGGTMKRERFEEAVQRIADTIPKSEDDNERWLAIEMDDRLIYTFLSNPPDVEKDEFSLTALGRSVAAILAPTP